MGLRITDIMEVMDIYLQKEKLVFHYQFPYYDAIENSVMPLLEVKHY